MSNVVKFIANTEHADLLKNHPIPSIKVLPKWYKDIPQFSNGDKKLRFPIDSMGLNVTVKRCIPFLDALTSGYTYVLEEDIHVSLDKLGAATIRWRTSDDVLTWHSVDQFPGLPIPESYHFMVAKWRNDWSIELPKGYSALFTHPSNRFDLPFLTLSGVVDCDSYSGLPVQFPFILKKDFEGIIEAGTPICQLQLMKRDNWKSEIVRYNKGRTYLSVKGYFKTFAASYKKNFWSRKSYK